MAQISNKEALAFRLQKMYWMEAEMEQLGLWEARIELMGEDAEAIELLSADSERHHVILEKWLQKANIEIPTSKPAGLPSKNFDFDGMDSPEMFRNIMKYEILARDTYIEVRKSREAIKDLFIEESVQSEFIEDMGTLAKEEEQHRRICEERIGGFRKITGRSL
ncbi:hypothetical protein J2755_001953 [Methanohalophilus levihalophilus]|uniref:hypothetical protein n=1 Tax=Methanohalophilus levihalophilus TaxID=1431282 RepID=UPI001AE2B347|nr:hypothetical protein [Methanohalophilus levihalophilus]MBP2031005.1 hypothetical protein [Methanohalophilus levihalophilus]